MTVDMGIVDLDEHNCQLADWQGDQYIYYRNKWYAERRNGIVSDKTDALMNQSLLQWDAAERGESVPEGTVDASIKD